MQNRRICTVADLPKLDWATDQIGGSRTSGGSRRDY
jgi:hypothetical protein